jgi:integrase
MTNTNHLITPDKFLDRDQRDRLLKVCSDRADLDLLKGRTTWPVRYMLVDLALYSGLRVAEITSLRHSDIIQSKQPYIMVQSGKGGKKRAVYIRKQLADHIKQYEQYKAKTLGLSTDQDSYLFSGRNGKVPTITLQKSFIEAVKAAGLPKVLKTIEGDKQTLQHYSIHSARHTYATFLYLGTKNLRYVQRQLGHSNISMTSLYADILPEENGTLANMID